MKNRFIRKVLSATLAAAILISAVSVQYPLSAYAEGEEPGQQTEQTGKSVFCVYQETCSQNQ